jgi:hypothetical protein
MAEYCEAVPDRLWGQAIYATFIDDRVGTFLLHKWGQNNGHCFCIKAHIEPAEGPAIVWADTVVVTPSGGHRLGKDPHDLMVIPC